jgi:hypothetical protein
MRVPAAAMAWLLLGCARADLCSVTNDAILDPDGGTVSCVSPDTCPRPDNLLVCLNTGIPEEPCVRCVDEGCIRVTPVRCD